MSVRTDLVEVICDGPRHGNGCPDDATRANYGTAMSVRRTLREDGWEAPAPGGLDRCPECRSTGGSAHRSRRGGES